MVLLRNVAAVIVSLVLTIGAGFLSDAARPAVETDQRISPDDLRAASTIMPITLLGQLRINLDDYLWLKSEDYLHFGLAGGSSSFQAKMIQDARNSAARLRGSGNVSRRTPEDRERWKGIFRKFEFFRPVDGYHGDPLQLLPWFRVQTKINPLDKQAYLNGAFYLVDLAKKPDEAIDFLHEGIAKNPTSPELHEALGRFHFEKLKEYDESIPYFEKAVRFGKEMQSRNDAEEEAFGNAYLFLARAHRKCGDLDAALRAAEEGVTECPDNVLVRAIYRIVSKDVLRRK